MKTRKLFDPVYRVNLFFIVEESGEKAKKWLIKEMKDKTIGELEFQRPVGAKSIWDNEKCKDYAIWIRNKKDLGHLVHETRHIADMVLMHRGIKTSQGNLEPPAYYQEFLFNEFMKLL